MKAGQIYDEMSAQLIREIESGMANPNGWRKPWAALGAQRNATTQRPYAGFNQLVTNFVAVKRSYEAPVWATYQQWGSIGAQVRKGERATHLVKWVEKECKHPDGFDACDRCHGRGATLFPVGFGVFNAAQVDGYTYTPIQHPQHERVCVAEQIIEAARASGLAIIEADHHVQALYRRASDVVSLPALACFESAEAYYATVLHELAHASGHERRLNRLFGARFGDDAYAFEELVAEFASAFLCAVAGIADCETARHGDYLANWARVLRNDSSALPHAASKAQQAADYWLAKLTRVEAKGTVAVA